MNFSYFSYLFSNKLSSYIFYKKNFLEGGKAGSPSPKVQRLKWGEVRISRGHPHRQPMRGDLPRAPAAVGRVGSGVRSFRTRRLRLTYWGCSARRRTKGCRTCRWSSGRESVGSLGGDAERISFAIIASHSQSIISCRICV